jgi:hypothetical protein
MSHIFPEFGMLMMLVRLIKMCLNEICSRVQIGKQFSFSIQNGLKQGGAVLPLIFNFPLEL